MLTRRQFAAGAALASGAAAAAPALAETATADLLTVELEGLERGSGGRLGVALLDTGTGRVAGYRLDERFPLCSTFKVLAAAAVLARVDGGVDDLDRRVVFQAADLVDYSPVTKERVGGAGMTLEELCAAAMTLSDNTAGNLLLAAIGGPPALNRYVRSLGDDRTRLDRIEPELNEALPGDPRDTTTPAAMARNLNALVFGPALKPASRATLTGWLEANKTGDTRLRAGLPAGWRLGDKTGSGERGTANDVAVVWPPGRPPIVVAAYLTGAGGSGDERSAVIAGVGRSIARAVAP
ncbi:class A beta-lactamase [Chelatococcus reniformis]|uniref:Beta-lactamase n=1 Tax=Chelatococcus reniformis TaxID=1494448 RepID=A0A916TYD0_9HYPH|nr:class A beta-lactamase [Chelatococcus reniformis]GGC51016.1 beta-lactamase [Chelatococcus reniformis]